MTPRSPRLPAQSFAQCLQQPEPEDGPSISILVGKEGTPQGEVVQAGDLIFGDVSCRGLKLPWHYPSTALGPDGQHGAFTVPFLWGRAWQGPGEGESTGCPSWLLGPLSFTLQSPLYLLPCCSPHPLLRQLLRAPSQLRGLIKGSLDLGAPAPRHPPAFH